MTEQEKTLAQKPSKLPQTAAGWVQLAIFAAIAGVTAWQTSNGNWATVALGVLGAAGTMIRRGVIGSVPTAAPQAQTEPTAPPKPSER